MFGNLLRRQRVTGIGFFRYVRHERCPLRFSARVVDKLAQGANGSASWSGMGAAGKTHFMRTTQRSENMDASACVAEGARRFSRDPDRYAYVACERSLYRNCEGERLAYFRFRSDFSSVQIYRRRSGMQTLRDCWFEKARRRSVRRTKIGKEKVPGTIGLKCDYAEVV